MKKCSKCKEIKPFSDFHKSNTKRSGGYQGYCIDCTKKYFRTEKHRLSRNRCRIHRKERNRIWRREYRRTEKGRMMRRRQRATIKGKLSHRMSNYIRDTLIKGKGGRTWQSLVGYSANELKAHLEAQFQLGMNWDNYGEWHIDHKIPIKAFNFDSPEHIDFKRCWALENLQPMWADENIKKAAKLRGQFQPMLKLESA